MGRHLPRRLTQGTAGRLLELLRRGAMTVDELAVALEVTRTAIRGQLATLEQDGLVEQRGSRRGASKPSRTYGVTTQGELLFSRAYIPILPQPPHVRARRLTPEEFDSVRHDVGRGMMADHGSARGSLEERVLRQASRKLSLSELTLPHEMARLVLAEQLYRAGTIVRGEPYHKG